MEPFPEPAEESPLRPPSPGNSQWASEANRSSTVPAAFSGRVRSASLRFLESNPPNGMWHATGEIASRAPTLAEIRRGSFSVRGWTEEGQMEQRGNSAQEIIQRRISRANSFAFRRATTSQSGFLSSPLEVRDKPQQTICPQVTESHGLEQPETRLLQTIEGSGDTPTQIGPDETGTYPNGYRFPPKHTWKESITIGLNGFSHFVITPFGFVVAIYGLNIVAWGAMIFFLLLNAAPAMCHPSCDADSSARKKWIEIDSQVLNALFCVTGFGLIPWRFRDLYWLMGWRLFKNHDALRKLAGIHRAWFRLPESDKLPADIGPPPVYTEESLRSAYDPPPYTEEEMEELRLNPAVPLPPSSIPPAPLTSVRAAPTRLWLLDLVVWLYVWNTIFQVCLSGLMWGMNRFTRPSWAVGLFISVGCGVAMAAGFVVFLQGRVIKKTEGIPVDDPILNDIEKISDPKQKTRFFRRTDSQHGSQWFRRH